MFWRRRDTLIDSLIKAPTVKFVGHDQKCHEKAKARRIVADRIKKRAGLIASGSRSGDVLNLVRKAE